MKYHLTTKNKQIMKILWDSNKPLCVSDIMKSDDSLNENTIKLALRVLSKSNLIKTEYTTRNGKTRYYTPTIAEKEFETKIYLNAIKNIDDKDFSASNFLATMLDAEDTATILKELEQLEDYIQKTRQSIQGEIIE